MHGSDVMDESQATVYFIDDQSQVLNALRRALRSRLKGWTMIFEASPRQALDQMAKAFPWVVLVEKKMPEMDGADFLKQVKINYPDAVRVILSADISDDTVVQSAGIAHLLLPKPFELDEIVEVIERAVCLRTFQLDDKLRAEMGQVDNLPLLPANYQALVQYLDSVEEPDPAKVDTLLSHDVAVLSKILQLANSAFFCAVNPVYSAREAVIRLGYDLVRKLVLCFSIYTASGDTDFNSQLLRNSERVAEKCIELASFSRLPKAQRERAYFTGLLHNIGALVISGREVNASFELVGSFLLRLWGFEQLIVDALRYQSNPEVSDSDDVVLYQLHIAKALVDAENNNQPLEALFDELDPKLIERAMLSEYLESYV
ncbi:HDOD domain-containing protein [Neptuniibacter marinus]|uniref:HDOD domain-containing protein n=1 Tax=Neptuniibacter marinus TaxID=1806670 RepID=UPI003B594D99